MNEMILESKIRYPIYDKTHWYIVNKKRAACQQPCTYQK